MFNGKDKKVNLVKSNILVLKEVWRSIIWDKNKCFQKFDGVDIFVTLCLTFLQKVFYLEFLFAVNFYFKPQSWPLQHDK